MSRGQLARTPANFPRMKHRAFGRLIFSTGGGYYCGTHGIHWTWGKITFAEYEQIQQDIDDHEREHDWEYAPGDSPFDRWEAVDKPRPAADPT